MCQVFYPEAMEPSRARQRGSKELWLNAAYEMLVSDGIDAVKVLPLAKKLNLSRTGFYWFFPDLNALHNAMISRWENQNTDTLVAHCELPADTICEALFNLMDCWLDPALFDAKLDLAIRNWARVAPDLDRRLTIADRRRIAAVAEMFLRFGYSQQQAEVRSLTVMYTQIGYISMDVSEARQERLARVANYVEIFAGTAPKSHEVARFLARHT